MSIKIRRKKNWESMRHWLSASGQSWFWNLPYIAVGVFAVAMLALVWVLQKHETDLQQNALERDVQWAEQTMRLHLQANQEFLSQLAREKAEGTLDRNSFQIRATQHIANNPELVNIVWVDEAGVIGWAAPFETTDWIVGESLTGIQPATFARARAAGRPIYGEAYITRRGVTNIELHVAVERGTKHSGAIIGVYSMAGMIDYLVPSWFGEKYRLSIEDATGQVLGANSAVRPTDEALRYAIDFDPPGNGLRLRAVAFRTGSPLPGGMPVLIIVGLTLFIIASLAALRTHVVRRVQVEKERDRLFNLSLDMLCIASLEGAFWRVNPAFTRILGYSPEALMGTGMLQYLHADDVTETREKLRLLASGTPVNFENRCRCADGQYKWLAWSINPVIEEKLVYAVAHDVTNRKRADEALRAEYAFRKAMDESVVTGLHAIDMEGRMIYVNAAFCRMVGWSAEELVGAAPPFPYWPPEERISLQHKLGLTTAGQAPAAGFEQRIQRRNGERFYVRLYVAPLIDRNGRQTGWMASMNDITEPKRIRADLEAAHERFVAVLDGLDASVYVADVVTDEILYANRACKNLYGFDILGKNCWQVTQSCHAERKAFQIDPRRLKIQELPRELFDGEIQNQLSGRWYHLRNRAIRWVDGQAVRMEIATDITDRKRAEEISLQQQDRLQQTSRLITMGEMASSLAHELNQPLSAIVNYSMGCVNRLKSKDFQREELLGAMEKTGLQAERAGKIIRRMRAFVKKSAPNRAAVSVVEIIDEAVGFAEIEARKAGVRLHLNIPDDVPPVFADKIMIEQVLLNLVKNSIEAMQGIPAALRGITISAQLNPARMVEIAVSDHGPGISSEQAEKLFEPFYTTKPEGMGMGLNICRSIIEFHDGRLWAHNHPEGGCEFRFTLTAGVAE